MSPTWKKVLTVVVPVAVVTAAFLWWYTRKAKPVYVTNSNPATIPPKKPAPASAPTTPTVPTGSFPLQSGSRNSYVKQLQTALGVTPDGIFGPITLAALQSQQGISSVPDQATLNQILQSNAPASGPAPDTATSTKIYALFNQGGYDIHATNDTFASQVNDDLTPMGTGFQITGGDTFDNSGYRLTGISPDGMFIMDVLSGPLAGKYILDPNSIGLASHPLSLTPTTDPSTGLTTLGF